MYEDLIAELRAIESYGSTEISSYEAGQYADAIEDLSKSNWIPVTENTRSRQRRNMKSKSYLFTYCYECENHTLGIGSVTMTQSKYEPINQAVIDDAIEWVRRNIELPDDKKIVPLAFFRFEDEIDKE